MNAPIHEDSLPPNHPFRTDPLFKDASLVKGAENFKQIVRSAFSNWNNARIEKSNQNGKVDNFPYFLQQLLETTTINLVSSSTPSKSVEEESIVDLPRSFFFNLDGLVASGVVSKVPNLNVSGKLYLQSLKRFEFSLVSKEYRFSGDTHFSFVIPEPAPEDSDLLTQMIDAEFINNRFAASLLMVDFSNPIFSTRRALLMKYVPSSIKICEQGKDLADQFLVSLIASGRHLLKGTPEQEFFDNWQVPEEQWKEVFNQRIIDYLKAIQNALQTEEGFMSITQLAEYRRYQFRQLPLFEFSLTLPTTNISAEIFPLEMSSEGKVRKPKS